MHVGGRSTAGYSHPPARRVRSHSVSPHQLRTAHIGMKAMVGATAGLRQ